MHIYRCELELMESLFFVSREINDLFQTEPVIGNYALAYAMGFCRAAYHNDGSVTYERDLGGLNARGIYVTPATLTHAPRFTLSRFNALTEGHFFAMSNNAIALPTGGQRAIKEGPNWFLVDRTTGTRQQVRASNFPQIGRLKLLSLGNRARFYLLSESPLEIPRYIRLGKFDSKAKVAPHEERFREVQGERRVVPFYLNPVDLPETVKIGVHDLLSVRPAPLIRNAHLTGDFYELRDGVALPVGLRFAARLRR